MEKTITIQTKSEIKTGLQQSFEAVEMAIQNLSNDIFIKNKNEKWSPAENLEHLILSTKGIASALGKEKSMFLVFGKSENGSRDFQATKNLYYEKLGTGITASSPYSPNSENGFDKQKLLNNWRMIGRKFQERIESWAEEDLDTYQLPHPALGNLTFREMLFFTIFHNEHHRKAILKYAE